AYWPELQKQELDIQASGKLRAELLFRPANPQPWTHTIAFQMHQGKFSHPHMPVTLDSVEASVRYADGRVTLDFATARSGDTQFELQGAATQLSSDADFSGTINIAHLHVNAELFQRLPENLKRIHSDFAPSGMVQLRVAFRREGGAWTRRSVVRAEDLRM